MKQKEKNKVNPFDAVLHPDERVLWSHISQPLTPDLYIRRYMLLFLKAFILLSLLYAAAIFLTPNDPRQYPTELAANVFLMNAVGYFCLNVPLLGVAFCVGYPIMWWFDQRSTYPAYAVTNRRVLHIVDDEVISLPLEEVMLGEVIRTRRTLVFRDIPSWRNVENAAGAVKWIRRAKEMMPGIPL